MLLRDRLTLLVLSTLVVTVAAVILTTDAAFGELQRREYASLAQRDLERVASVVEAGSPGERLLGPRDDFMLQFVSRDGRVQLPDPTQAALPLAQEPTPMDAERLQQVEEGPWTVASAPWVLPSGVEAGTIRIAVSMADAAAARATLRRTLAWTGAAFVLLAGTFVVLSVRRTLRPLTRLAQEASAVDPVDPHMARYDGPQDEVGMVASGLNRALDAIRSYRQAERERLADVAHELAAPLTVVTGHLSHLARRWTDAATPEERERLRAAEAASDELLHASKDLLTLARGDLDAELSWEVVDLGQLARQVTAAYPGVHLEGVPLTDGSQDAADTDLRVVVDPVRMRQVLRNLVRNAVRAAGRPQGVTVRVRTPEDGSPEADDGKSLQGETLRLEVEDDGPGLRPEEREAIFGRYVTGSGGTGLGLAVVRRLTTLLGGTISVRSEPGHGATFMVTLPTFAASVEEPESGNAAAVAGREVR